MKETTIYPGEYKLLPEVERFAAALRPSKTDMVVKPPMNIDVTGDGYRIEVAIPGAKRENICVSTHDRFLTVVVSSREKGVVNNRALHPHEFETKNMVRHILLPRHADIDFASVEYKEGILYLHLPRSGSSLSRKDQQFIVY